MFNLVVRIFVILAGAGIAAIPVQNTLAAVPRFEPLTDCFIVPPEDLDVEFDMDCGYVFVPEFYHRDSNRELRLGIMRLNSSAGNEKSPLFMLAGGPGQSLINPETLRLFQTPLLGGVLAARDIVIIDQRGSEHTDTFLDCPALYSADWIAYERKLNAEEVAAFFVELVQSCIDDFHRQGIDFDAYNSVENAADVNAVRKALGYPRIIYYGASYGSQLGQHVMRDFSDSLEAVVLDGANALSRKSWVEDRALDAQWGIDNLTKLCNEDAKCREAYDIPAMLDAALALFDDGALAYTYINPDDSALTVDVEVTINDLINLIYQLQGDRIGTFSLPAVLHQLTQGGGAAAGEILGQNKAVQLLASRNISQGTMATLMHFAMVCSDDPVKSADDVNIAGVGRYAMLFGRSAAEQYVIACPLINVAELPDTTDINVTVAVPTLVLSGSLDVATPVFRSQLVVDALPNARHVIFPGRTHVQITGINLCAARIATQFILDPDGVLDTSCTEQAPLLGFVLPDGSTSQ